MNQNNKSYKAKRLLNNDLAENLGKIPPQAIDLEEAVLGALILEKDALVNVMHLLKPDFFYKDNHKEIYSSVVDLFNNSEPVDLLTVTNRLRENGKLEFCGGAYYITELTSKVNSAAHIEAHSRIIIEKAIKRELIRIATEIHQNSYDDQIDAFEDMDNNMAELMKLSESLIGTDDPEIKKATFRVYQELEKAKKEGRVLGMRTGFVDIDRASGGFVPGNLIIIAARPGMGKTAFIICIAKYISLTDPVGIFSLEMTKGELISRLICGESRVSYDKFRRPKEITKTELGRIQTATTLVGDLKMYIYDKGNITFQELRSRAIMLKKKFDIKILILDYLQLMQMEKGMNKNDGTGEITKGLKALSKELKIPIVALSQLNRACETRGGDKKPQLADLRDSGNIEQDADTVAFLYRAEYYGFRPTDRDGQPLSEGTTEVIFEKHRHGSPGAIKLIFKGEYMSFYDYSNTETGEHKPTF